MRRAGRPVGRRQVDADAMLYGNYAADAASSSCAIAARLVDIATADPRARFSTCAASSVGYVSQFLRVIPRVAARDIVAEPLIAARPSPRRGAGAGARRCSTGSTCPSGCGRCRRPPSRAASSSGSTSPAASARASGPAARRADRLARCRQPRGRRRSHRREEGRGRRPGRHLPRSRRCATAVADRVVDVTGFAAAA